MSGASGRKQALVTGPHGIVGLNLIEELHSRAHWKTLAVGRRTAPPLPDLAYVPTDLLDKDAIRKALARAGDCTHLFFCAYLNAKDAYEESAVNVAMLRNTLEALQAAGAPLERVVICEGAKAYGALMGPMRTPAKENDPRVPGPLYYFDMEDVLFAEGARRGFVTTILRPDFIAGIGLGHYANLVSLVAVYATICKALRLPLHFPGGPAAFNALFQITDARLLARGMIWAAEAEGDTNEIYNITNGDVTRWSHLWPRVARYFEIEPGQVLNIDVPLFMRDKGTLWSDLARSHGLVVPFEQLINLDHWGILRLPYDVHSSTIRIRQAGFHDCLDTEERLIELFDELRARKFIP